MSVLDLATIKERIAPIAEKHGVDSVYVFGSYARGEATEQSDVDLCIECGKIHTLFQMGGFYADAEEVLGKEIDLITKDNTPSNRNQRFRNTVEKEMVKIYEQ